MQKDKLRARAKELLKSLDSRSKLKLDNQLSQNLEKFLLGINFTGHLGVFDPLSNEPVWFSNWQNLKDLQFCFPANFQGNKMQFALKENLILKQPLNIGIELKDAKAKIVEPKVILVPGLMFTTKGERLGRGGGFYDRYLDNFKGLKVGLCYELQLTNSVAAEELDQKMNVIITEKKIYNEEEKWEQNQS